MTTITPTKILKQFSGLKPNNGWSFANESRANTSAYTHSYHRYPAKFIPQIVDKLVTEYTNVGDTVLDPFGGCGTTLVESKLLGRQSIGIDVNPIAKLITQVKVTPIKPDILKSELDDLLVQLEKYSPDKKYSHHIQRSERIYYWFDEDIVHELDYLYSRIKRVKNEKVRKFFLVAFSHNLKNASKWLMKSIKPTIDKKKVPQSPIKSFTRHIRSMAKKNTQYYAELNEHGNLGTSAKMYRKDATKTLPVKQGSVNLIVTSPPYVTSYEYADLHQLSLLWFGNDSDFKHWNKHASDFSNFRKDFIGTKHKNKATTNYNSTIAGNIVDELGDKKKGLATSVGNYFADMNMAFSEMHQALKKGGHACVVIGNTNLKGVDILNAEVAAEQMNNIGFKKVKFIKREAANNKAITPWRDIKTGKFTSHSNKHKKMAYQYEYILIMQKV